MNNKDFLVEGITQDIVLYLMNDMNCDMTTAMNIFYNSMIYRKLEDERTGLYYQSSKYVYSYLKDELSGK